jgi:hypothetical protein
MFPDCHPGRIRRMPVVLHELGDGQVRRLAQRLPPIRQPLGDEAVVLVLGGLGPEGAQVEIVAVQGDDGPARRPMVAVRRYVVRDFTLGMVQPSKNECR